MTPANHWYARYVTEVDARCPRCRNPLDPQGTRCQKCRTEVRLAFRPLEPNVRAWAIAAALLFIVIGFLVFHESVIYLLQPGIGRSIWILLILALLAVSTIALAALLLAIRFHFWRIPGIAQWLIVTLLGFGLLAVAVAFYFGLL